MAKPNNNKVTESQAAEVHALTVQILELQAKQMLLTGEIDNAGVRNMLTYLKQQDVTVDAEEDPGTISLVNALKEIDLNYLRSSAPPLLRLWRHRGGCPQTSL